MASYAQRRLWFLDQLARTSSDALLPLVLRLHGPLDVAALSRSLTGIVERHEVLRTRFVAVDGEPVPRLDPAAAIVLAHTEASDVAGFVARESARPMDLATEPPLRMSLARVGPDEHLLLLLVHHVAVDGWSWNILLRELAAGYRGEPVPAPAVQYAEVARAEAERLDDTRMRKLLGHWRTRLAGLKPLALPTDRPRPAFWNSSGDVVRFTLPAELVADVDRFARGRRATRYMVLLAVYQALLAHHSGQRDIAVCTTLAERSRPEVAGLIGPLVNTIVLRTDLTGGPSFTELLDRVRSGALTDFSHAEAPFDRVVGEVGGERSLARHPLAQASFTLLNVATQPIDLPGLHTELVAPPLASTPLDVFLDLTLTRAGGIIAQLQYARALFDEDTMRQFGAGYVDLLRAVLADPLTPVGELAGLLPALPGRERRRLLEQWSGAATAGAEPPAPFAVGGAPGAVAVIDGDRTIGYGELGRLAGGVAAELFAGGLRPGDAVGVSVARGVRSVAALLGVWRAGGVYVPLDPALPDERLRHMIAEAGVTRLLTDDSTAHRLPDPVAAVDVTTITPRDDGPDHRPRPGELAYVIFTSGSTGRPKAVGIEHRALDAHVAAAREHYTVTAADRVLAFSSFSFDASLDQLLPALSAGAALVLRPDEQWAPAQLLAVAARDGVTVLNLPPTYWVELAHSLTDRDLGRLATVRLLILGGEAVPPAAVGHWQRQVPWVRVVNAYGPTEATVTSTVHDVALPHGGGPVPIGRPLGTRRIYLADADGELVAAGVPGELLIGGPELARGYLGRPALTAERFRPDPYHPAGGRVYHTGDLARWSTDGTLEFLGRADDQVKIRGYRIELGEIDHTLAGHPGVIAAATAARPDAHGGLRLIGYVVPDGGAVELPALRDWCAQWLPPYAVPSEFVTLDSLPVTTAGKLDRAALPETGPVGFGDEPAATPRDETERLIAEIWAEVLGVPRIGIDDSFFELGGHSLLATMAVSRVAARLDRVVELRTLFENPRIREFGPVVAAARRVTSGAGVVPVDRAGALPLSYAQERLWFLDRMSELGDEYVLWFCWRVGGGLDRAAWQGALDDVVARHEVLRTALVELNGRPAQLVRPGAGVPLLWEQAAGDDLDQVRERAVRYATGRFDLADPPMIRSGVWELAGDDHVVVIAFHHVATDGWSKEIVIDELSASYRARLEGRPAVLPPVPVQYGDYAVWQRGRESTLQPQLEYWREALADLPALDLPTDRPRPATWSGRGAAVEVTLDPALIRGVEALGHRYGVTRFMVLLAIAQVALARWSGQYDVPVGSPVAGRGPIELERLVGFFVNTVVLRTDLAGDPTFATLLDRVRETVLGAFDHQELPFERLVEDLRPERDLSRNPLFQVMFDVQEGGPGGPRLGDLATETFGLPWGSAKFDLTATFLVGPDRFGLAVEYSTDLFDDQTVFRFATRLGRLLTAAVADPLTPIGRLPVLSPGEQEQLLALAGPGGSADRVQPFAVCGAPEAVALVCDGRTVRYRELEELIGGISAGLRAAGLRPGDAAGVQLARGVFSIAAMLGIWHAGGVYVPLDPALPADRLRHMVTEAGLTTVVTDGDDDLGLPVLRMSEVRRQEPGPGHRHHPGDLAYVIFTSGSTGRPKAVGVEHHALDAHVATARDQFALRHTDRVLTFASLTFDASLEQILPALSVGARVVMRPDEIWSVEELAAQVRAEAVTVMELTPAYWEEVVAVLDRVADDLRGLRLLVTGGEVLPAAPLQRWFARLPEVPVINTYGPTEAVISATAHPVHAPVDGRVPIGRPLGRRRAYIVDQHDELAPAGVPGELLIGGSELARGYLGQPALTAERFTPDPYHPYGGRLYRTGDLARWNTDGTLDYLGRTDHQVKIRGFRIELGEVEHVLTEHPEVVTAAVQVRVLHGERALVAYAVTSGPTPDELIAWCRRQLPAYAVPMAVVTLAALPRTVQGKLDAAALPDPEPPAPVEFVAPRDPTEQVIAQIWAEVLGLSRVGAHDDFFALGGHSLRAVAAASRLRAAFDVAIQVRDLFEHPTVGQLAAEVEQRLIAEILAMSEDEIDASLTAGN